MSGYPHLVILQKNIYVGGGDAGNDSDECTVLQYNMESDKWCRLPRCMEIFKQILSVTVHPQILALELRAPMGACLGQYGTLVTWQQAHNTYS